MNMFAKMCMGIRVYLSEGVAVETTKTVGMTLLMGVGDRMILSDEMCFTKLLWNNSKCRSYSS